jgi:hypothetical protein
MVQYLLSTEWLESVLAGWREQCGGLRSLRWLRDHAERLGPVRRVTVLSAA